MKILLVDDHAMMRHGLRAILEKELDVRLVEEAANGRAGVKLARTASPDVILMDIAMPELNGLDATRQIMADNPKAKVIVLSMNADAHYVLEAFDAGAVGYIVKEAASSELLDAVRAVRRGQAYVSPAVAKDVVDGVRTNRASRPSTPLSSREREVLQLLAEGMTSKGIAAALRIGVPTVETHRRQVMAKLGIHTIAELTKYAVREGLTSLEK